MAEGSSGHSEIAAYATNLRKGKKPKEALQVGQWKARRQEGRVRRDGEEETKAGYSLGKAAAP